MGNLIVVAFEKEDAASHFLSSLDALQQLELIKVDDAAIVVRSGDGKVKVKQASSLVGFGLLGGAFWGMFVGLLFWQPLIGMAVGAAMGAGIGKASDYGLNDGFIKEVGEHILPGTSAVFMLVSDTEPNRVIAKLKPLGGEIIHTSLSYEQEARLREAFAIT